METIDYRVSKKDSSVSNVVAGFDNVDYSGDSNHLYQPTSTVPTVPSPNLDSAKVRPSFRNFYIKELVCIFHFQIQ